MQLLSRQDVLDLSNGQVTSTLLFLNETTPDPNGLFSKEIFGESPKDQKERFGHIELNCKVFHPHILRMFKDAYRSYYELAESMSPFVYDEKLLDFVEIKEEDISKYKPEQVFYGFYGFIINLHRVKRKETKTAETFWNIIDKYGTDKCVIDIIPVIPIFYRNYKNMYQYDQINDIYLNILRQSSLLSKLAPNSNDPKYCLAINYMQKHIYTLYEFIQSKISKKTGFIRQYALGKRLDFSGRSVITVDPTLKPDEVGVPFRMAVSIFEPWILSRLTKEYNYSIPDALEILQKISKGMTVNKDDYNTVRKVTELVVKDRYVLMKRDPNLHRGSIKAFRVRIVEDNSVHMSPIVNASMAADFDGDSLKGKICLNIIKRKVTTSPPVVSEQNQITLTSNILELRNIILQEDERGFKTISTRTKESCGN